MFEFTVVFNYWCYNEIFLNFTTFSVVRLNQGQLYGSYPHFKMQAVNEQINSNVLLNFSYHQRQLEIRNFVDFPSRATMMQPLRTLFCGEDWCHTTNPLAFFIHLVQCHFGREVKLFDSYYTKHFYWVQVNYALACFDF